MKLQILIFGINIWRLIENNWRPIKMMIRKKQLFHKLVTSNRYIETEYLNYKNQHSNQIKIFLYLKIIFWNLKYRILRRPYVEKNTEVINKSYEKDLSAFIEVSPEKVVSQLLSYDIISFDIFYTLIFRPFLKPDDFFDILAVKYNIINFKSIRLEAERKAHSISKKKNSEADIFDIYKIIEKETGIPVAAGVKEEFLLEKQYTCANPFMFKIFQLLKQYGKKVIAVSDMYFPKNYLKEILEDCGYKGIDDIFVSCECEAGKWNGSIYPMVMNHYGSSYKYIHIGDNYEHDIKHARKKGWDALYFPNIHKDSSVYLQGCSSSICQGLINIKFSNNDISHRQYYRFGYEFGGRLVVGFCLWLNKLAKEQSISKFLFLSRDGDIISQVYNKYFNHIPNEYVLFSRFFTNELAFEKYTEDFLDYNIRNRALSINPKQSLQNILKGTDLEMLIPLLRESNLCENDLLDEHNCEAFCSFIYNNKEKVVDYFRTTQIAAQEYFEEIIGNHQKICLIDVGWRGSSTVYFKEFINNFCKKKIEIIGALVATSDNSYAQIVSNTEINHAYLFSPYKNRDLLFLHNHEFPVLYNNFVELFFSSEKSSFLKFKPDENGRIQYIFSENEGNHKIIQEIQEGILDFAKDFCHFAQNDILCNISPYDAYIPIFESFKNRNYYYSLFKDYKVSIAPSIYKGGNNNFTTLGAFMKQEGYIN